MYVGTSEQYFIVWPKWEDRWSETCVKGHLWSHRITLPERGGGGNGGGVGHLSQPTTMQPWELSPRRLYHSPHLISFELNNSKDGRAVWYQQPFGPPPITSLVVKWHGTVTFFFFFFRTEKAFGWQVKNEKQDSKTTAVSHFYAYENELQEQQFSKGKTLGSS